MHDADRMSRVCKCKYRSFLHLIYPWNVLNILNWFSFKVKMLFYLLNSMALFATKDKVTCLDGSGCAVSCNMGCWSQTSSQTNTHNIFHIYLSTMTHQTNCAYNTSCLSLILLYDKTHREAKLQHKIWKNNRNVIRQQLK